MSQLHDAVIVDYLRSAFSRSRPREPERDVFGEVRMDDVAGELIKELLKRTGVKPEDINEVLGGTAQPWSENTMMGARFVAFLADLPFSVAGQHIDRQCGSSSTTINTAAMSIMLGYSDVCVSFGIEHMTRVPMGSGTGGGNPRFFNDPALQKYNILTAINMGLTAEKLLKHTNFTREDMDKYAVSSHDLAVKAIDEGYFKGEIMPVEGKLPDGTKKMIDVDQAVRRGTTLEALSNLKPAYTEDGQITAGNSSPLNAGATSMMLMSREKANEYGLKPLASIVGMGWAGVDPSMMGLGPVPATKRALAHAGMDAKDIDLWEINEAFSIVTLNAIKELGIDREKVNRKGGALAIGHPLGASGTRLVGTLARILNMEGGTYGVATLCCGGGQGIATILKREA